MIVLSAGMQKAGSGWFFNLTNDLLIEAGYSNVREVRRKFALEPILKYYNCNIESLTFKKYMRVLLPAMYGYTFTIKTHASPTKFTRVLMRSKVIKATYVFRDPRDVAVSAFEHGQKIRSEGKNHTFAQLEDMESAVSFASQLLTTWEGWIRCNDVLIVRYEDLIANPKSQLLRLQDFLSIDANSVDLDGIVSRYEPQNLGAGESDFLHFNRGRAGRFREVMSWQEKNLCVEKFGDYLQRMGYTK
jgi:hypothetical protein